MSDYCVRYVDLPYTSKGVTIQDDTGFYNIYINSALSFDEQQEAICHELKHIRSESFDESKSIEDVEPYRCYKPEPVQPILQTSDPVKEPPAPSPSKAPQKVEIATLGQLMRFMVNCENKRQNARQQAKKRVSVDIWGER